MYSLTSQVAQLKYHVHAHTRDGSLTKALTVLLRVVPEDGSEFLVVPGDPIDLLVPYMEQPHQQL